MKIKVIGESSSNRMKMLKNIWKATKEVKEVKEVCEIEILEDKKYLNEYEISNTPCLIINEKIISQGKVLNDKEIKNYIRVLA